MYCTWYCIYSHNEPTPTLDLETWHGWGTWRHRQARNMAQSTMSVIHQLACHLPLISSILISLSLHITNLPPALKRKDHQDIVSVRPQRWAYVHNTSPQQLPSMQEQKHGSASDSQHKMAFQHYHSSQCRSSGHGSVCRVQSPYKLQSKMPVP